MKALLLLSLLGILFVPLERKTELLLSTAGDIACPQEAEDSQRICQGKSVFRAMPKDHDAVIALGDLIQKGEPSLRSYKQNFFRTWPVSRSRFYPVPGNHDYYKDRGQNRGYRKFLSSENLEGRKSWYSWRSPSWLFIGLDSNCQWVDCSPGSEQLSWLKKELEQSTERCILAYFHHPLFHTPGPKQGAPVREGVRNFWKILNTYGADVVLNGHWHHYERFPALSPEGTPGGIRQFTVGTGGGSLFETEQHPLSDIYKQEFGFLSLRLRESSYSWQFIDAEKEILDWGSGSCRQKISS